MVPMGAVFLVGGRDVLVGLFIFMVLTWVNILSPIPRPSHGFSSSSHKMVPNVVVETKNKLELDNWAKKGLQLDGIDESLSTPTITGKWLEGMPLPTSSRHVYLCFGHSATKPTSTAKFQLVFALATTVKTNNNINPINYQLISLKS